MSILFLSKFDINNVFPEDNKRLTLEDSRLYERKLKTFLLDLKEKYPDKLSQILKKFHKDVHCHKVTISNSTHDELNQKHCNNEIKNVSDEHRNQHKLRLLSKQEKLELAKKSK